MSTFIVKAEHNISGRGLILDINTKGTNKDIVPGNHLTYAGKAYTVTAIETSRTFMYPPQYSDNMGIQVKEIAKNELREKHHVFISEYVDKIVKTYDI